MSGAGFPEFTVKLEALVPVPAGVVTLIGPVVAPAGTVVVIWVVEFTVKTALVPLNVTELAELKFDPAMTTLVFCTPLAGVKLATTGAGFACPTSVVSKLAIFGDPIPVT